jgi:hypothetical protein
LLVLVVVVLVLLLLVVVLLVVAVIVVSGCRARNSPIRPVRRCVMRAGDFDATYIPKSASPRRAHLYVVGVVAALFVLYVVLPSSEADAASAGGNLRGSALTAIPRRMNFVIVTDLDKKSFVTTSKKPQWKAFLKQVSGDGGLLAGREDPLLSRRVTPAANSPLWCRPVFSNTAGCVGDYCPCLASVAALFRRCRCLPLFCRCCNCCISCVMLVALLWRRCVASMYSH